MSPLHPSLPLLLNLLSSLPVTLAFYKDFYPQPLHYCAYGCQALAPYITFNIPLTTASFAVSQCTNNIKLQSLYACAQAHCTPEEYTAGMKYISSECERNTGVGIPEPEGMKVGEEELGFVQRLSEMEGLATLTDPSNGTAIPDRQWHEQAVESVEAFYGNVDTSYAFAWAMYGFWGVVVVVGMGNRFAQQFVGKSVKRRSVNGSAGLWNWLRRKVILPATFGHRSQDPLGWCTIPPRLESSILVLYVVMNVVMCFPGYHLMEIGNVYYATSKIQIARYVSDRTGFLAIAQLPIVWVFAARNDPFLWVTGWDYATYNRFHRWVARLTVVEAIVHSICYSVFSVYAGTWTLSWSARYWICGVLATVAMSLMLGISIQYFRSKAYDLFLICHTGLAVIVLVGVWFHVKATQVAPGQFYGFLWPCIAMWALDRVLRFARTFKAGLLPQLTKKAKATAAYDEKTKMIRLDVTGFLDDKIVPGLFYYVYVPKSIRGYESHPFTLCSWRRDSTTLHSSEKNEVTISSPPPVAHTFLIRPYECSSFTGCLQKRLQTATDAGASASSKQISVLLEGPYRQKLDLSSFSDVLSICGGSGITPVISHAHYLLSANTTTKIHIHWAVPQREFVDDVVANELAAVIRSDRIELTVYLASGSSRTPERAMPEGDLIVEPKANPVNEPRYRLLYGRPDIEAIMVQSRAGASESLAVVSCGPPSMADTSRAAVAKVLKEGGPHVQFYNETLTW
ncbi:putative FAD-binding 8, ferric reductase, NAD binding domain-containing protein [Septoria linicola]|nr:putative FAD-binding 8, ferric reductase, NAD binding domain-containing protein [Septoria linicola]